MHTAIKNKKNHSVTLQLWQNHKCHKHSPRDWNKEFQFSQAQNKLNIVILLHFFLPDCWLVKVSKLSR